MAAEKIDVTCPCCESKLMVDAKTGEVIWEDKKPKPEVSLSDMVKDLNQHEKENQSEFLKQSTAQKERTRLLDEKFKESQKHVDKSGERPLRDFDFD